MKPSRNPEHAGDHQEACSRRDFLGYAAGLAGMMMLPGCDDSPPLRESPKTAPGPGNGAAFFKRAAEPYRGTVIRGISDFTPPSAYARDVLAPAFEKETGIKVDFEAAESYRMWDMIHGDMEKAGGKYDFVYVEQDFIYDYLEKKHLVSLTELFRRHPKMISPDFSLKAFTSFIDEFREPGTGDLYGIPLEGFIKACVYRKDLFDDPEIGAAFFKQHGYALSPAITMEQYRDNAAFFTEYGRNRGLELWGTGLQATTENSASFWAAMEMLPRFGVYNWGINPANHRAHVKFGGRMNSARAKQALAYWLGLLEYAPPEATRSTWTEIAQSFADGRTAQSWIYGENIAWIATDKTRSRVTGKVGVTLTPTLPGVLEEARLGKGYVDYYDGGAFGIPRGARNREATLLWLQYIGLPRVQPDWAVAAGRIVHMATFDDPKVRAYDRKLGGYFSIMKKYGHLYAGAPPFSFIITVRDNVAPFIQRAVKGELTADEALDLAANALDKALSGTA